MVQQLNQICQEGFLDDTEAILADIYRIFVLEFKKKKKHVHMLKYLNN